MSELLDLPHEIVEDILKIVVGTAVGAEPNDSDGAPKEAIKPTDAVEGVMLLLKLRSTCAPFRSLLDQRSKLVLRRHGVSTWEQLVLAVALKSCEMADGGNRIGFEFASIALAGDDGEGSDVAGSRSRIGVYAAILKRHKRASVTVEAHCGPTAPPSIAHAYSLERANLVVNELTRHGISRSRITPVGHGKRVSASSALRESAHPNAASARSGFGWAEIFVQLDGLEQPRRPDFYSAAQPPGGGGGGAASCASGGLALLLRVRAGRAGAAASSAAPDDSDDDDDDDDDDENGQGGGGGGGDAAAAGQADEGRRRFQQCVIC